VGPHFWPPPPKTPPPPKFKKPTNRARFARGYGDPGARSTVAVMVISTLLPVFLSFLVLFSLFCQQSFFYLVYRLSFSFLFFLAVFVCVNLRLVLLFVVFSFLILLDPVHLANPFNLLLC
jgi:hypothetical protein